MIIKLRPDTQLATNEGYFICKNLNFVQLFAHTLFFSLNISSFFFTFYISLEQLVTSRIHIWSHKHTVTCNLKYRVQINYNWCVYVCVCAAVYVCLCEHMCIHDVTNCWRNMQKLIKRKKVWYNRTKVQVIIEEVSFIRY